MLDVHYAELYALEQHMEHELDPEKRQAFYWRIRALREKIDPPSGLVIDSSI